MGRNDQRLHDRLGPLLRQYQRRDGTPTQSCPQESATIKFHGNPRHAAPRWTPGGILLENVPRDKVGGANHRSAGNRCIARFLQENQQQRPGRR
jgi:hypothetical protein